VDLIVAELVNAGLLDAVGEPVDNYVVHDYAEYQPTRALSAKRAEGARKRQVIHRSRTRTKQPSEQPLCHAVTSHLGTCPQPNPNPTQTQCLRTNGAITCPTAEK
jgi:hypothetical protein